MAKNDYVRARVNVGLKEQAEAILKERGLTMSAAILMMLRQVVNQGKLPFPVEGSLKLNERAQKICDALDRGEGGQVTEPGNSQALFERLGV